MNNDENWMRHALELAARGRGHVEPNPMVGCIVVYRGKVLAEGWHAEYGKAHAEVAALDKISNRTQLAECDLYVSLEPCSHFGKTPPCADRIIRDRVKRVIFGCHDPNGQVAGSGIAKLQAAGIEVAGPLLERECIVLNKRFFTFHKRKRPYVLLKWAESSDGFIAREDFSSKWISGETSRVLVHRWRTEEQAILVGTRTARYDNPQLTARHVRGRNPLRAVIDRQLRLPNDLALLSDGGRTLVFNELNEEVQGAVQFCKINDNSPLVEQILARLHAEQIISVLVEGGSRTLQSFIDAGLWDEARVFTGVETFGGGIRAPRLEITPAATERIGADSLAYYERFRAEDFLQKHP